MNGSSIGAVFAGALSVARYTERLSDDRLALHRRYRDRAPIDDGAVALLRDSAVRAGLVITEPWCGDSLAIFPVLEKLFADANLNLRVALRDEHPELMDQYLTRGGRAIPILITLGEHHEPLFRWGPRPAPAQAIVEEHREAIATGRIERAEVHKMVRSFYARDGGATIVRELLEAITRLRQEASGNSLSML